MGMVGTFDGFTTARLGIYAAQKGLMVTGNNISNINTVGYTRQRMDQVSLKTGAHDMYRSQFDNHVGSGALVTSINQVRDPYLDIRYRNTASDVGYRDTWLSGLQEIADTLDEVGKGEASNKNDEGDGVLYAQLQDLRDMLMQLHNDPTKANDTLVRNSAETLCTLFNTYAKNLETMRQDTEKDFYNQVDSVNEILTNIRDLNEAIRKAEICGDNALEMRDERNLQIDALAAQMSISVEYTMEDVGGGIEVEKLTIRLGDANPDPLSKTDSTVLVDGIYGSQIYVTNEKLKNPAYQDGDADDTMYLDAAGQPCGEADAADSPYTIWVSEMVDKRNIAPKPTELDLNEGRPIMLADNDLHGSFQALRELLTEKGEFATTADVMMDPQAASKRGIPYYQMSLDLLARKFAETYNELNQGTFVDQDGNPILDKMVEQTIPALKEMDGKVYAWNDTTKEYEEKAGWAIVDVGGVKYAAETIGDEQYFTGLHGTGCTIYKQLPVNDTEKLYEGIKKISSGQLPADMEQAIADGNKSYDDPDVKAAVYALLDPIMRQHGVGADSTLTVDVPVPVGGPLFSNRNDGDDTTGINATNISVSHSWSTGDVQVVPKFEILFDGTIQDSTQNTNIDHMISKIDEALTYNPQDLDPNAVSDKLFTGSFNDMFDNMASTLAKDQRSTNTMLNEYYTQLVDIDSSRDGVSGVDLNDEAMNMMQYQKAYSAACRLMTVIDSVLDRLINNTGVTV